MHSADRISERYHFFRIRFSDYAALATSTRLCDLIQEAAFLFFEYDTFLHARDYLC